jgi:hypothetical protein
MKDEARLIAAAFVPGAAALHDLDTATKEWSSQALGSKSGSLAIFAIGRF